MKTPWEGDDKGQQVLCDWRRDGNRTITVGANEWPLRPWRVADLMNTAYATGYAQAQHDMRRVLGVKE